ncbi:hypothetical protein VI817_004967 [Penicillium citrinum]|nr:hypothetical protein VI817_004967 [Penicillium citrinum]
MANFISFTIRPAPWDPNKKLVHPAGYPVEAPPIYSIASSKSTSPNVVLFLGWGEGPHEVIGDGKFPKSFHSTCHLTLRGQSLEMRSSQSGSGDCKFDHPFFGHMKWKADMISSSKMELRDGHGRQVATFGKGKSGEKTLDIMQGDPYFMELVLLSGITAINLNKGMGDAAMEVFSAIAGA